VEKPDLNTKQYPTIVEVVEKGNRKETTTSCDQQAYPAKLLLSNETVN